MQRNQKTFILNLHGFKPYVEYQFSKRGTLIFESDINKIIVELVECCLGNSTRDNLTRCQRNIFLLVPYIVDSILSKELHGIIRELCNELEATYFHTMRMDADPEPAAYCFTYDTQSSRLSISAEAIPVNNGWVDHRAYSYEMQTYLNGGIHEPTQPAYATGFNFRWRAV